MKTIRIDDDTALKLAEILRPLGFAEIVATLDNKTPEKQQPIVFYSPKEIEGHTGFQVVNADGEVTQILVDGKDAPGGCSYKATDA